MAHDELAACLRSWRDRLSPAEAGLPAGGTRRAPGLRREEVAQLAGLSVDYLAASSRAARATVAVGAGAAGARCGSPAERDHLYRVAGQAPPAAGRIGRHLTPGVQRVLDRLTDVPVLVVDAAWHVVAVDSLGAALLGDITGGTLRERNMLWRHFTGEPSRIVRSAEQDADLEAEAVGDLHDALGRYPGDPDLRALIDDLRAASPRFAELWEQRRSRRRAADRKTIDHPRSGRSRSTATCCRCPAATCGLSSTPCRRARRGRGAGAARAIGLRRSRSTSASATARRRARRASPPRRIGAAEPAALAA